MNIAKEEKHVESLLEEDLVGQLDDWAVQAFKSNMDYKVQSDAHLRMHELLQKKLKHVMHCCNTANDVGDMVLLTSVDHLRNAIRQHTLNALIKDKVLQQVKSTAAYSSNQSNWRLLGYHAITTPKFHAREVFELLDDVSAIVDPILPSSDDMYRTLNERVSEEFRRKLEAWTFDDVVIGNHEPRKGYVYKPESGMDSFRTSNDYKKDDILAHMTPARNPLMNRLYYLLDGDRHIFKITLPVTFLMHTNRTRLAQEAEVLLFRLRVVGPQDAFAACLKHSREYSLVPQNESLRSLSLKGWMKYHCDVEKEPYRAGVFAAFAYLESHAENDRIELLRRMDHFASSPGTFLPDADDNKAFANGFRFVTTMLIASYMLSKHPVKGVTFVSSDTLQDVYH